MKMLDRHSRRQPFTKWMKRLASLKHSSSNSSPVGTSKSSHYSSQTKTKAANAAKNNPYPVSAKPNGGPPQLVSGNGHLSFCTPPSGMSVNCDSTTQSKVSLRTSHEGQQLPSASNRSAAPTLATNPDTINSDTAHSKTETTATAGGAVSSNGLGGGEGSTFSSPAPSIRSMTTTLTTMQSTAPTNMLAAPNVIGTSATSAAPHSPHNHHSSNSAFSHQFPASPPASAIPSHISHAHAGPGHPNTYSTATANNQLNDNASIMTLASSSKRRRRNSLDTNASVRALAPSSLFGGSRESLPLSVLSANVNDQSSITGIHPNRNVSMGLANTERASVYSSSGITPAAERSSYYANKTINPSGGDGGSVRSGLVSHGRNDSITRSIGGLTSTESPLMNSSPREPALIHPGNLSRRQSGWGEVNEEDVDSDETNNHTMSSKRTG